MLRSLNRWRCTRGYCLMWKRSEGTSNGDTRRSLIYDLYGTRHVHFPWESDHPLVTLIMSATPPAPLPTASSLDRRSRIRFAFGRVFLSLSFCSLFCFLPPSPPFAFATLLLQKVDQTALATRACHPIPCLRMQSRACTKLVGFLSSQILIQVTPAVMTIPTELPTTTTLRTPTPRSSPLHR